MKILIVRIRMKALSLYNYPMKKILKIKTLQQMMPRKRLNKKTLNNKMKIKKILKNNNNLNLKKNQSLSLKTAKIKKKKVINRVVLQVKGEC